MPDTLLCEGDPALDIPQPGVAYFLSARPDEIDYRYGFLVVRDGVVEALVDDPDLSGAPPGEYRILGLSYSALDDNTVKNLPYGVLTLADLEADLASATPAFCGSLSENAINIGVGAPPPPERIDTVICQGEEFPAADTMLATSGVYNFNLLTAFGCDSLLEVDLTVLEPDTNFLIEPICPGDSLVVGSTAFYTPGNYEIGLTNQQGCDSIIFLELSWWPTPVTDLDTVICAGEILTIGGQSFSATGDYTVGLSTVNGCDSTVNLSLTVLAPEAVIDPPETITCDRTEVSLLGNNSLPASGLSYAWTDAGGTSLGGGPFLTVDRPGIYDLIVFQSQSGVTCTDTSRVEVTDERTFPAALVEPPSAVTCAMPELLLDGTLSTQAPQIKYRWETTGGRFASATDQAFVSVAAGGEYRLLVIDTLNGCQDTATVQVLEDRAAPLADAGGDRMLTCAEPSLVLDGSNSSAGPAFEYQWLSAAGLPVSGSDTPTPLVDEPGAYQLMVTDTRNGCAASDTATVGIDTIPPAVFIADPPRLNCARRGGNLDATASAGAGLIYSWQATDGGNISSGANTLEPFIDAAGRYTLTIVSDWNGCAASAAVTVIDTINTPVALIGGLETISCRMPVVELDASASTTGTDIIQSWSTADGNILTDPTANRISVDVSGTYQLAVVDTFTLCTDTVEVIVPVDTLVPLADAGPDLTIDCSANQVVLDGDGSDSGMGFSYSWSGPCLLSGADGLSPTVDCAGDYILTVVNTRNGCTASDTVVVILDSDVPVADAGAPAAITCTLLQPVLDGSASSQGAGLVYQWTGPGIINGANTLTPTVDAPGLYTLRVTDTTNNCFSTSLVQVDENTIQPIADAGFDQVLDCNNPQPVLDGRFSSVGDELEYKWSTADGLLEGPEDELLATAAAAGTYQLLILNTINGCRDSATVQVTADLDTPRADAGPDRELNCSQLFVELDGTASDTSPDIVYEWAGDCLITALDDPTMIVDCAGLYFITATNSRNGCSSTDTVEVTNNPAEPLAVLAADTVEIDCESGEALLDGSASSGGQLEWWFEGNPTGITRPQFGADEPGYYLLVVTDPDLGCVDSAGVIVVLDCQPVASLASPAPITCRDPQIVLDGSNSSAGATIVYQWLAPAPGCITSGASTSGPEVQCPGAYTLIVTNTAVGLSDSATVTLDIDTIAPLAIAGDPAPISCNNPASVLSAAGSTTGPGIAFTWTNAGGDTIATVADVQVAEPGDYVLEVLDQRNGCRGRDTVRLLRDEQVPAITFGDAGFPCLADTFRLEASVEPPGPAYQFQWSGPGIVADAAQPAVLIDTTGWYFLQVTDPDNGCSVLDSVLVTGQDCVPCLAGDTPEAFTCLTATLRLAASFCKPCDGCQLLWSTADGIILEDEQTLAPLVGAPGRYVLSATDTLGFSSELIMVVPDGRVFPVAEAGDPTSIGCGSAGRQLKGQAGPADAQLSFQWSSSAGGQILDANTLMPTVFAAGIYYLEVTDADSGCRAVDSVLVSQDTELPVIDTGGPYRLDCRVRTLDLEITATTISGQADYLWTTDQGRIIAGAATARPTVDLPGDYRVVVTDPVSGCMASAVIGVEERIQPPVVTIGTPQGVLLTCRDAVLELDGRNSMAAAGGELTFQWTDGSSNPVNQGGTDGLLSVEEPGIYRLLVTENSTGCSDSSEVQIDRDVRLPEILSTGNENLTCSRSVVVLDASGSAQGALYASEWRTAAGSLLAQDTSLLTVQSPGTYQFTVTRLDNGCSATESFVVLEDRNPPQVSIAVPPPLDCDRSEVLLEVEVLPTGNAYTFLWSTTNGSIVSGGAEEAALVNAAGRYEVEVTNTDNACRTAATVEVEALAGAIQQAWFTILPPDCLGDGTGTVRVDSVLGGNGPYMYALETDFFVDRNTFTGISPGSYTLRVQDSGGCEWSAEIVMPESPRLEVDLGPDVRLELGDSLRLQAGTGVERYDSISWSPPAAFADPSAPVQVIRPLETETYSVAVSAGGCLATDRITVFVAKEKTLYIPNVFSPDGDGINDIFMVYTGENVRQIRSFLIFNRWGEKVFQAGPFMPNDPAFGWDGTFHGKVLNEQVFVYYVEVEYIDGRSETLKGDLLLMR